MPGDFADAVRPQLEGQLEAGETLRGLLAATHQKTFGGGLYAIGVTDRRLLLQPFDRKLHPKELLLTRGGATILGGESQQEGVAALGEWLAAAHASA